MKNLLLILTFITCVTAYSQESLNELSKDHLVNFETVLIDYEIYNDRLVALTKDHGDYFIYFQDSSGAGLFQTIEIFFPTGLDIDDRGDLYISGLDSAFQLSVTTHVEKISSMDYASYMEKQDLSTLYFESTKAEIYGNMVYFYDDKSDSLSWPSSIYQIKTKSSIRTSRRPTTASRNDGMQLDQPLENDLRTNINSDIVQEKRFQRTNHFYSPDKRLSRASFYTVHGFRSNENVWLIDEEDYDLVVLSEYGTHLYSIPITPCPYHSKFLQDASNGKVYVLTKSNGITRIQHLDQAGTLKDAGTIRKGFFISDLRISNDYLYYRDSKGKGESIKRVKLN